MMSDQPSNKVSLSATARAAAQVGGIIRSFEQSQVIFCVTFLILFLASIGLKAITETVWTDIGAGIGLLGLMLPLLWWLLRGKPTKDQNRPASVTVIDGDKMISARDIDSKEAVLEFRNLIQNRQILPPPHGEVIATTGTQPTEVRIYTEEERRRISEQLAAGMREHDQKLLAQLEELIRESGPPAIRLPNPTEPTPIAVATQEERTLVNPASR